MKRQGLIQAICAGAVLLAYAWLFTGGSWIHWPGTSTYYDQLASAFQHGHLELALEPGPALLALPDPYEHSLRREMPSPWWDMSFYNGKFYLYWGPVPALMLAVIKFIVPGQVSDSYLVFAFLAGAFLFNALLLSAIWRRFFQDLPAWTLALGILLAGLACPLPWLLTRPKIYEAAMAAGLFFFNGGLYWFFTALARQPRPIGMLAAGSAFWALAIGSRATMLLPVLFMELMVLLWIAGRSWRARPLSTHLPAVLAMGLPLFLAAAGLGWYNYARFGSVFEIGLRYQLTIFNLNKYYGDSFSPAYFPLNIRNYLVIPFRATPGYPFIEAIPGVSELPGLNVPKIFRVEQITGLLYSFPFAGFALVAGASAILALRRPPAGSESERSGGRDLLAWLSFSLAGVVLLSFASLLLFRYASMRYLADIVPPLLLLSVCGFWEGGRLLRDRALPRRACFLLGAGLAAVSILVSVLLGIAGYVT